jgi:hypothetical protein
MQLFGVGSLDETIEIWEEDNEVRVCFSINPWRFLTRLLVSQIYYLLILFVCLPRRSSSSDVIVVIGDV